MLLHVISNSCGRIRPQIANGFSNERPTHSSWWEIKPGVFSFDEEDEKKRNEEGYNRAERSEG